MIRELIRKFKEYPIKKKLILLVIVALILVLMFSLLIYAVGMLTRVIAWDLEGNPWWYALEHPVGRILSFAACIFVGFLFFSLILNTNKKNASGEADERGIHVMDKGTLGSAKWMKIDEAKKVYNVGKVNDISQTIYGQYTDKGERVVAYKEKEIGASGNRNVYMLAAPGSGKSFTFVRTEILQALKRGESVIVTDPSGELYTDLSQYCRDKGADVKVLNVSDPNYSDFWDCLEETIDPETERLDDIRLSNFVSIYMKNSKDDVQYEVEDFWYTSANNVLQAVVAFTAFEHEQEIISGYVNLYTKIKQSDKGFSSGKDSFIIDMKSTDISFKVCREIIKKEAKEHNYSLEEINKYFEYVHKLADINKPYTIEQVIKNLNGFNATEGRLATLVSSEQWLWHPAADAYIRFRTNDNDNVRKSAIQGAQMRFKPLSTGKIKNLLSHKGIHISDINLKQSVYFVVTSDKPTTTKPIISLFFSFVFTDAQETYDKFAMLSKEKGYENPCLPVSALLDEFFSLGVLCGSAEAFGTVCSTCRKRKIYLTLVTQTYSQLEALYGKHIKDVIQGCCETMLFLGGNDLTSLQFVSDSSGETTVLSETHEESTNLLSTQVPRPGYRTQGVARNLLTKQESRKWKNKVLVVRQGEQPLEINPFPWTQHPAYLNGECIKKSIYTTIKPISTKIQEINFENRQLAKYDISKLLANLNKFDFETGELLNPKQEETIIDISKETTDTSQPSQEEIPKENAKSEVPSDKPKVQEAQGDLIELNEFDVNKPPKIPEEGADTPELTGEKKFAIKMQKKRLGKKRKAELDCGSSCGISTTED